MTAHRNVEQLLCKLLNLQEHLQKQNVVTGKSPSASEMKHDRQEVDVSEDEDIPSEEEGEEDVGLPERSSKRKLSSNWPTSPSKRCYEAQVERLHVQLRSYRDAVISKWNEKTRLATGKITSKVGVVCSAVHSSCP